MKRMIMILFGLLLCFGALAFPAAAEDAAPPETAAQTQNEPPALSPYEEPKEEDYKDYDAYNAAYSEWSDSIFGRYFMWRNIGSYLDEPQKYDPAFRAFYAKDPDLIITNHFVYKKENRTSNGKGYVTRLHAVILDYFDTDEAEAKTKTLRIPATLDGLPVAFCFSSYGTYDGGYTNNTVQKLILEEGPTRVAQYAFSNFTALKTVQIADSVKTIAAAAFQNCTALTKVTGCGGLQTLENSAFQGCGKLASFANLEKVQWIQGKAFHGCGFRALTLSGNATLGGGDEDYYSVDGAFAQCPFLKQVTFLPGSKKGTLTIGINAFADCSKLKTVVLPKTGAPVTICVYAFRNCAALKTIQNTNCLAVLDRRVFEGCALLKSLTLPAGFQHGAFDTFRGSSLKELDLRSKDTKVFDGTYGLFWDWVLEDGKTIVDENFLTNLPKTCTVYVANKDMKYAVKSHGFKGMVKIRVNVPAPTTAGAAKQNGKWKFTWSKVKTADGYRIWSYNPKTGKYTKLATVKAPKTTVTLKSGAKKFVIRAYRIEAGDVSWSAIKAFK